MPTIVMGDFNDEPFNRSMIDYALSTREQAKATSGRAQNPYLYNLMTPLQGSAIGTHKYQGEWFFLDQILANKAALDNSNIHCEVSSIHIIANDEVIKAKDNQLLHEVKPRRFNRPSNEHFNPEGYSDHLPIAVELNQPT